MLAIPFKLLNHIYFFYLLSFLFLLKGCEKHPTPIIPTIISLTTEYVGVIEADLRLQINSTESFDAYQLLRDGQVVLSANLTDYNILLYDTTLAPVHTYNYQAVLFRNDHSSLFSNEVSVTTMDTTSHDFAWTSFTIESPFGSGLLFDVAIIDENDIWAVGMIAADSVQPWVPYNAVHWDGIEWELKRIPTNSIIGLGYYPINSVFSFNSSNIWMFSNAGSYCYWDGYTWESEYVTERQGGINEIWGLISDNIYFVGTNGNVTRYLNGNWQKLTSNVNLDVQDIWGVIDQNTGEQKILAVACNLFTSDGSAVLEISNTSVHELNSDGLPLNISSVWSPDGKEWYICGDELYQSRNLNQPSEKIENQPLIYMEGIRGNGINDVFVVGHSGFVAHFNGVSWYTYLTMQGKYYSLAVKNNLIVAVGQESAGFSGNAASILMGRRN